MSGATSATATATLAAQAAGASMSAVGAFGSASGNKTALKSQAQINDLNAQIDEENAQQTLKQGQAAEQSSRLQTAQVKSSQKTSFAGNGIALDGDPTSSVNNVLTSTDVMGDIEANTIHANAVRAAWGQRVQAVNETNKGVSNRAAASAINPFESGATSLLGSATQFGSNYLTFKKAGAFKK